MYQDFIKQNKPLKKIRSALSVVGFWLICSLCPLCGEATEAPVAVGAVQGNGVSSASSPAGSPPSSPPLTTFEEGKHYQRLKPEITQNKSIQSLLAQDPGKVHVIEFFNYACYGCSRVCPLVEAWIKTKSKAVVLHRFSLVFHKPWEPLARAFYIIKALNKIETLDPVFFSAIYEKRLPLHEEPLLEKFFVEQGVSSVVFSDLYHSFAVNNELEKGKELADAYRIAISPALVVNGPSGSYLLSPAMAGSQQNFMAILNYLVDRELPH